MLEGHLVNFFSTSGDCRVFLASMKSRIFDTRILRSALCRGQVRLMETQTRAGYCSRSSGEPERKRRGGVGALLRLVSRRRPHGEDFRRYPGGRPYRDDGPVNAFELRVPRSPSRPFFPSPSAARFAARTREGGERAPREERCATPMFFHPDSAVEHSPRHPPPDFNPLPPPSCPGIKETK